jgi:transketolase
LKPLDADAVAAACSRHRVIITLEEHSIHGGLGAAICEITAARAPVWVCRIGIPDRFSKFCGSYSYLLTEHGLDDGSVLAQIDRFLAALPDGESIRRRPALDRSVA